MQLKTLLRTREAGTILRFHAFPTIRNQTIGEHSWGVANILIYILDCDSQDEVLQTYNIFTRSALLKAGLHHDVSEIATGDVPAHVKWANPELSKVLKEIEDQFNREHEFDYLYCNNLSAEMTDCIKFADLTELLLFSLEEYKLGNKNALVPLRNGMGALEKCPILDWNQKALQLYQHIKTIYRGILGEYPDD